ncbi:MAG: TonB family protein [Candidatus Acidiferrales bacterium]
MSELLEFTHGPSSPAERRKHVRQRPKSLTYVELEKENGGIVLDANENGISVQAVVSLNEDFLPHVRLRLPDSKEWLQFRARVVWTRESRKVAGLQFEDLSEQARSQLQEWLSHEDSAFECKAAAHSEEIAVQPEQPDPGNSARQDYSEVAETRPAPALVDYADQFPADPREEPPRIISSEPRRASKILSAPFSDAGERAVRAEQESDQPSQFPRREAAPAGIGTRESHRVAAVYLLLFILAVVSLAAGWAAGRGKFALIVRNVRAAVQQRRPASQNAGMQGVHPAAAVKEIQIVDINNQRWTVFLRPAVIAAGPLPAQVTPARAPAPAPKPALNFQIWTLTAPKRSASSGAAEAITNGSPPEVNDRPGSPEISPMTSGAVAAGSPTRLPKPAISTGDLKRGALLHRVEPDYPEIARDDRVSGTVILNAKVGVDGAVRSVDVISGPKLLTLAAENAVRHWRYAPTLLDGKAIETEVRISLVFHLPNAAQ